MNENKTTKSQWTGRILSGLVTLNLTASAVMKFVQPAPVIEGLEKLQLPTRLIVPIGILELLCVLIYAVPKTAVLGAVLLTGYLGGAVLAHLRAADPWFAPLIVGSLMWLGIFLREKRLGSLIPLRK